MAQQTNEALARLRSLVEQDLQRTNEVILEQLNSPVELITQVGDHLLNSGGKRLRPILTLVTAKLFGYQKADVHALLAAVVEFIHTATLLHDDVVDKSNTRRGQATANSVWGNKAPILVGDFLFSRSFQIMVEHGDLRVLRIVSDCCAIISEGEVMQLVASNDLATDEERYLDVIRHKTASLFASASQLGAVVADQSDEIAQRMYDYGMMLGTAYQVVDDLLDYSAETEKLGKNVGDDFQEGKITLPVIHAFRSGDAEEQAFWRRCLEDEEQDESSFDHARALIAKHGSLDYTMSQARALIVKAKAALAPLPESAERQALMDLADLSVDREY
ncbi:Trans-hexaprenyltranstransferase [Magnetococcus marinus MC-1]|uniref:Octaprenyl diphosphate synthase n=1 Tax=Magnetococcus marinus (strain ATCC BAA-1437 / JCM 17883 / MC-1) TaxID=156889 RepID=A0LCZ7_MAGMM|nr:polyprenyl synthetase family protein [Magnetococcus marinus]ABK45840.1 Trans-hexaprenyltranstransferase [Magnetococcus marinus MC-1]